MSRKKTPQKDESIIRQIQSLKSGLTSEGFDSYLSSLSDTKDFYKHKTQWTPAENIALRVFNGRLHPDEMCEAFMCSYLSLTNQMIVLGLIDLSEGRLLCAEDVELFIKMLNTKDSKGKNKYTPRYLCDLYGFEYDKQYDYFTVSTETDENIKQATEQGDFFDD